MLAIGDSDEGMCSMSMQVPINVKFIVPAAVRAVHPSSFSLDLDV